MESRALEFRPLQWSPYLLLGILLILGLCAPPSAAFHNVDLRARGDTDPNGLNVSRTYVHTHAHGEDNNQAYDYYNYLFNFGVQNVGGAYSTDGWDVEVNTFTCPVQCYTATFLDFTVDIPASPNWQALNLWMNDSKFACCGGILLDHTGEIAEDVENNNGLTDNEMTVAMHAAQVKSVDFAILNFASTQKTFAHSTEDLPSGWSVVFTGGSTTAVTAGAEGTAEAQITAPGEITSWPDFKIWSRVSGDSGLDQFTWVKVRDDTTFQDSCT